VTVNVTSELEVAVEVATLREDNEEATALVSPLPKFIYSYLRLYDQGDASIVQGDDVAFVAGVAVYPLQNGDSVTIHRKAKGALRTDGQGTFLYQEVWGSRYIPYDLEINLAPGLIPLPVDDGLLAAHMRPTIQFSTEGCRIRFKPDGGDETGTIAEPWLADIRLFFRRVPELAATLNSGDAPFNQEMPFGLYKFLLHLYASETGSD
jgi:hypothetical protein